MNDSKENTSAITSPEAAIKEFVGEQFILWLMDYMQAQIQFVQLFSKLNEATATASKTRKFILQRFLADAALLGVREGDPGFLGFAIANLSESDDPEAESALEILEQKLLAETARTKNDSSASWLRSLDISEQEIAHAEPKEITRAYIAELSDLLSVSEWPIAIGALVSFEKCRIEEQKVLALIFHNTNFEQDGDDRHDINANHILDKLAFDVQSKQLVWQGAKKQLDLRREFLEGLSKYLDAQELKK